MAISVMAPELAEPVAAPLALLGGVWRAAARRTVLGGGGGVKPRDSDDADGRPRVCSARG
ncbi:MAG: hypothetical protein WAU77_07095 [Solirubrobacteraceae bacterium]